MNLLSKEAYIKGILEGNTIVLSRAITLLESTKTEHNRLIREVLEKLLPYTGKAKRIGVTGVPGVGKSTFIEAIGEKFIEKEGKLAVLAIDPSSQISKGSILGDKTRMEKLAGNPKVYIRPSATGNALGGVGRKTREIIMLCEAAQYNYIIVETVGVGQSETAVHSMVDCFFLLLLPGAGDELQGIKRGIMEMADIIAINKAYLENKISGTAKKAMQEIRNALHYFPKKENSWLTKVLSVDALYRINIEKIMVSFQSYFEHQDSKNYFVARRKQQDLFWFHETIRQQLLFNFYESQELKTQIKLLEQEIIKGKINSFSAAEKVLRK